ncbi:hypothetical protein IJD44_04415 [bacterium]|nr:hypothetical protein [bacterium]
MGIGIFNKLKRFGRGFISGIKDIFNDPKVKENINVAKNDVTNVIKNSVKNEILDKNKLLKGLTPETIDNIKDVVSFASRKWIPKFKN